MFCDVLDLNCINQNYDYAYCNNFLPKKIAVAGS